MDRSNIDKIAANGEQRMLLAKLWDKINAGIRRNIPANTPFLSPAEQEMARYLFGNEPGLHYFGGYEGSERQMLCYLPDYLEESALTEADGPVICLRASFYGGDKLTHRDFLGALMGCGIARETIGDICVGTDSCDFFVTAEIAPYILQNLTGAGRTKLRLEAVPLEVARIPAPEVREIRDTVSSLRLDSVIASGFRMSRGLAAQHIAAGKAAVNALPCEKADKLLSQGDKVSLRGQGKLLVAQVGGQTKKGRISVVLHRYV